MSNYGKPPKNAAEYRPWDQDTWLSEPPWNPTDPALMAWEAAHGHDVRMKCYPEFGCMALNYEADEVRAERDELRAALAERDARIAATVDWLNKAAVSASAVRGWPGVNALLVLRWLGADTEDVRARAHDVAPPTGEPTP